ncbi:MAG: hypothetical protein B7Y75_03040 [Azorhizobium sp. 35-67-5]|nr:MAG: hypothetical protein B7Y75_03040 [Azorhizobium sp. 35-67-5]
MVFRGRIALTTIALSMGVLAPPALADTDQTGVASYYWQGKGTASGERFNANAMTAAHRSLPFNTKVQVTNLRNGRSVVVRINDRGPFIRGRIIDVSKAAAGELGFKGHGLTKVSIKVIGRDTEIASATPDTSDKTSEKATKRTQVAAVAENQATAEATPDNGGWTLVPSPSARTEAPESSPTP